MSNGLIIPPYSRFDSRVVKSSNPIVISVPAPACFCHHNPHPTPVLACSLIIQPHQHRPARSVIGRIKVQRGTSYDAELQPSTTTITTRPPCIPPKKHFSKTQKDSSYSLDSSTNILALISFVVLTPRAISHFKFFLFNQRENAERINLITKNI